ncbi:MAG TPA: nitroreductase family protein [Dehalococcoidia bacterium]|nr:nitroreductase family protein [Dehalococcoidia bacterium]
MTTTRDLPDIQAIEELLATQRAIRFFADRPVDDALIERVLRAATRAPSARNAQPWRFIVVRNRETKAALGKIFDELGERMPHGAPERMPWEEVPVLIAVCAESGAGAPASVSGAVAQAASIYPAVQNMLLAAHALGLGTVMTTRWKAREEEVKPLLGVPENVAVYAIVPMGWPDRAYGRGKRRPVRELTYRETYGNPWK